MGSKGHCGEGGGSRRGGVSPAGGRRRYSPVGSFRLVVSASNDRHQATPPHTHTPHPPPHTHTLTHIHSHRQTHTRARARLERPPAPRRLPRVTHVLASRGSRPGDTRPRVHVLHSRELRPCQPPARGSRSGQRPLSLPSNPPPCPQPSHPVTAAPHRRPHAVADGGAGRCMPGCARRSC